MPPRIHRVDSVLVDSLSKGIYNQEKKSYGLSKMQISRRAQMWYEVYRILELKRRYTYILEFVGGFEALLDTKIEISLP